MNTHSTDALTPDEVTPDTLIPATRSTKPRTFGIGIIGCGIMGRRMLAALLQHPRFRVAVLWDPDAIALQKAAALAASVRVASSAQDLIQDPAAELIYIASPPGAHAQAVRAVLAAGRACLCEKPLTHTAAEAAALAAEVQAAGLAFAVNFPFARSTASLRLADIVNSGEIGVPQQASIRLRFAQWPRAWQAGASDWLAGPTEGGFTREVLSHFVFLALRLFGPAQVADVRLTRDSGRSETTLQARLQHAGLDIQVDAAVGGEIADDNRFEIIGSRGRVALVNWASLEYQGQTSPRADNTPLTLDAVAAMLEGRSDHGLATVGEAAAVVRCIESLLLE
jgi:predicted dehydrogenase